MSKIRETSDRIRKDKCLKEGEKFDRETDRGRRQNRKIAKSKKTRKIEKGRKSGVGGSDGVIMKVSRDRQRSVKNKINHCTL